MRTLEQLSLTSSSCPIPSAFRKNRSKRMFLEYTASGFLASRNTTTNKMLELLRRTLVRQHKQRGWQGQFLNLLKFNIKYCGRKEWVNVSTRLYEHLLLMKWRLKRARKCYPPNYSVSHVSKISSPNVLSKGLVECYMKWKLTFKPLYSEMALGWRS